MLWQALDVANKFGCEEHLSVASASLSSSCISENTELVDGPGYTIR